MSALLAAEGDLETALGRLAKATPYADVLAEEDSGFRFRIERNQTNANYQPHLTGAIFRAWTGQRWAEAVARSLAPAELNEAADALARELSRTTGAKSEPPGDSPTGNLEKRTAARRPVHDVAPEEWIERGRGWFDTALAVPGIANAFAQIGALTNERLFRSSTGARRYQSIQRVLGNILPIAMENGRVEYDGIFEGATSGYEFLDAVSEARIRESAKISLELLRAGAAPTGPMTVLLDPSTAGTFAHESFGHGTEADQLLRNRSYLKPLLGQTLGPESLTLVDEGAFPDGWGAVYFDDEGTPAHRTVLVDRGRFVEVLHDRETAASLHRQPTGNARRSDFLSRTFVRMTNTFVEPGDWSVEELLKEARDGILLSRCTSGIEDPLGGQMQIKVKHARRIVHGELGERYSSMALSGRVLDVLKHIRGVGRRDQFEMSPGFCGKGHTDLLPAGTGGPYLLTEAIVGPA
jgi:TldD protein